MMSSSRVTWSLLNCVLVRMWCPIIWLAASCTWNGDDKRLGLAGAPPLGTGLRARWASIRIIYHYRNMQYNITWSFRVVSGSCRLRGRLTRLYCDLLGARNIRSGWWSWECPDVFTITRNNQHLLKMQQKIFIKDHSQFHTCNWLSENPSHQHANFGPFLDV